MLIGLLLLLVEGSILIIAASLCQNKTNLARIVGDKDVESINPSLTSRRPLSLQDALSRQYITEESREDEEEEFEKDNADYGDYDYNHSLDNYTSHGDSSQTFVNRKRLRS